MEFDFSIDHVLGFLAGLLMIGLGVFVLAARPESWLHRVFFALAAADGASTILFELSYAATETGLALWARLAYDYAFIAFVFLLLGFALFFPTPALPVPYRRPLLAILVVAAVATLAVYTVDYRSFWSATREGDGIRYTHAMGNLMLIALWTTSIALALGRMSLYVLHHPSETHRRQAAFMLGGVILGYGPFATTTVVYGLRAGITTTFFAPSVFAAAAYWGAALATLFLVTCAAALLFLPARNAIGASDRHVVVASASAVLLLTFASALLPPTVEVLSFLATLGLVAFPLLLGYSIVRYGVLGVDARTRRTAILTIAASAATAMFLVIEEGIENVFAGAFPESVAASFTTNAIAALAAAALVLPVTRALRRVARRFAPESGEMDVDARRIEIYGHAVHGALADGVEEPLEVRALARLRESLRITDAEDALVRARFRATLDA